MNAYSQMGEGMEEQVSNVWNQTFDTYISLSKCFKRPPYSVCRIVRKGLICIPQTPKGTIRRAFGVGVGYVGTADIVLSSIHSRPFGDSASR